MYWMDYKVVLRRQQLAQLCLKFMLMCSMLLVFEGCSSSVHCAHGGTCRENNDTSECVCPHGFTGSMCEGKYRHAAPV